MKRKFLAAAITLVLVLAIVPMSSVAHASQPIRVAQVSTAFRDDGEAIHSYQARSYLTFEHIQPMMIDDRVFVPLRALEQLDVIGRVHWYESAELWGDVRPAFAGVTVQSPWNRYELAIIPGSYSIVEYTHFRYGIALGAGDFFQEVLVAARIVEDRMMVPLRMLQEFPFIESVEWDGANRTVVITIEQFAG